MQPLKKTYKPAYLDYVYKELLIFKDLEELPPAFHAVVKANLAFKTKLGSVENYRELIKLAHN